MTSHVIVTVTVRLAISPGECSSVHGARTGYSHSGTEIIIVLLHSCKLDTDTTQPQKYLQHKNICMIPTNTVIFANYAAQDKVIKHRAQVKDPRPLQRQRGGLLALWSQS